MMTIEGILWQFSDYGNVKREGGFQDFENTFKRLFGAHFQRTLNALSDFRGILRIIRGEGGKNGI